MGTDGEGHCAGRGRGGGGGDVSHWEWPLELSVGRGHEKWLLEVGVLGQGPWGHLWWRLRQEGGQLWGHTWVRGLLCLRGRQAGKGEAACKTGFGHDCIACGFGYGWGGLGFRRTHFFSPFLYHFLSFYPSFMLSLQL